MWKSNDIFTCLFDHLPNYILWSSYCPASNLLVGASSLQPSYMCVLVIVLAQLVSRLNCITESSYIMNHELFFTAWPIVSSWLRDQYIKAIFIIINQRRLRNLQLAVFNAWVEEAGVFPPPLVSSSDDDWSSGVVLQRKDEKIIQNPRGDTMTDSTKLYLVIIILPSQ